MGRGLCGRAEELLKDVCNLGRFFPFWMASGRLASMIRAIAPAKGDGKGIVDVE